MTLFWLLLLLLCGREIFKFFTRRVSVKDFILPPQNTSLSPPFHSPCGSSFIQFIGHCCKSSLCVCLRQRWWSHFSWRKKEKKLVLSHSSHGVSCCCADAVLEEDIIQFPAKRDRGWMGKKLLSLITPTRRITGREWESARHTLSLVSRDKWKVEFLISMGKYLAIKAKCENSIHSVKNLFQHFPLNNCKFFISLAFFSVCCDWSGRAKWVR